MDTEGHNVFSYEPPPTDKLAGDVSEIADHVVAIEAELVDIRRAIEYSTWALIFSVAGIAVATAFAIVSYL